LVYIVCFRIAELREAFTFFDEDGNERISTSELRKAMQCFGDNPTVTEAEEMINAVDRDGKSYKNYKAREQHYIALVAPIDPTQTQRNRNTPVSHV
jgi:hypothetical protein